jgi:hypothetical protein
MNYDENIQFIKMEDITKLYSLFLSLQKVKYLKSWWQSSMPTTLMV